MNKWIILKQKIYEWWLNNIGYHFIGYQQQRHINRIKQNQSIKVAFVVNSVAMWKYQSLYDCMKENSLFKLYVILSPAISYKYEHQLNDLLAMRDYFSRRSMDYIDWEIEKGKNPVDIRKFIDPDIIFYGQPYHGVYHHKHCFLNFVDRLLCYYPYGYLQIRDKYTYDQVFNNIAWKIYLADIYQYKDACVLARNKGKNAVVVGYPSCDLYLNNNYIDVWKEKEHKRRRLIWAPHFTLANDGSAYSRSNFLYLCDFMLQLADEYRDVLQIAFKPHPSLKNQLYKHEKWGKKRTDNYYREWEIRSNTQLETGDFISLFNYSDAMVHDCDSFVVDYLYFKKPVMYISKDINVTKQYVNELSRMAYDSHYIGKTTTDIKCFIDNVLIKNIDVLLQNRNNFYINYLLAPNSRTVAENTFDDIIESLR